MEIFTDQLNNSTPQLYNAYDCLITDEVFENLNQLPSPGPIYQFSLALQAPAMEMSLRGIKVDWQARDKAISKLRKDLRRVDEILQRLVTTIWDQPWKLNTKGEPTFPNSDTQLRSFFYDTLGIKPITKRHKGETTIPMDRSILEKLQIHFQLRPILSFIMAHRDICGQLEVLETTVDSDWRMRCSINIAGTSTGRFSTSKSTTGTGKNMQNITEDLRYQFVCDDGYKLAAIDKEQAESREVGWFCGVTFDDWSYLNAVESGDIHTYSARLIWPNLPWTNDLKKDKQIANQSFYRHLTYRDMTKRCGHGTNYYGRPWTIANEIKVPQQMVKDFQTAYFKAFSCIQLMHQWVKAELQTKGYLINVFGRRRDFFDRHDSNETLRAAIAYMFQSATADDLNLGMWRIWRYMPKVELLLQLHDAIYFQFSKTENEEEIITTAQKYLDVELQYKNRKFIVPTEALTGYNFGHRYKLDENGKKIEINPRGLDVVRF